MSPPIDYIDADGAPAGFNTAVLAEIGRRLGVNIELISAQTGSRTMALTSGTADAVFWYMETPGMPDDMPEGLLWGLLKSFIAMVCVSLCIMPLSLLYFDETSLISPLMNVFIVPLCTAVLIVGLIYVFTGGAVSLLIPAKYVVRVILAVTDRISRIGAVSFSAGSREMVTLAFVLALAAVLVQLIFHSRQATAYALAFCCCIMFAGSVVTRSSFRNSFRF